MATLPEYITKQPALFFQYRIIIIPKHLKGLVLELGALPETASTTDFQELVFC